MKPMLQVALDNQDVESALKVAKEIRKYIDVIEVGTILISSEGKNAIKKISDEFKDKIIVADGKVSDAGKIFGHMFYKQGATFVTAICAAETSTMKVLLDTAKEYGNDKSVQVELTTNFTWEQAKEWRKVGIDQAVWHRARDAQAAGVSWGKKDLEAIKKLCDLGFKVTITGGVELEDIKLFKDYPIYIFIAGRSIRDAKNPELAAKAFQDEIAKYWA
ncbi:3-dehydro-L-gulonate-6-phosphate decarboxylase [Mycoplasma testudineum]|uniref:3-dehydro-L-gulonate-6-phosphate decarboxylase n=1 Tax=Mycoplasma testudineum TaxID=244584 RepID=A0A4R6IJF2_9MOLU|nr:3-keto-L-gulonate-6-phosphate decarboxylase UlaD [Mycoplasma testudineum]OYD26447.1 3-keto-L-gulonate-6-phosphate decarboxylase [Mycoplasma testudineum]TDO22149.1 3-dehydro-L-gulonate-6-phosphate decarboxylase [Mycoplasma testudineum]